MKMTLNACIHELWVLDAQALFSHPRSATQVMMIIIQSPMYEGLVWC